MASSSPLEFTLGLKPSYVPKSLSNLLKDLSNNANSEAKLLVLNDYLLKYQEELVLAGVFKQELPQCNLMLMDAIETLKEEIRKIKKDKEPVLEKAPKDVLASQKNGVLEQEQRADLISSSAEQWSNSVDHHDKRQKTTLKTAQALQEFSSSLDPPPSRIVELTHHDELNLRANHRLLNYKLTPLTQSIQKNKRRIWTKELHERFVVVLDHLGGPKVATPKQIRDNMQVDGLTTNQVKSHLQKYRRNYRRITSEESIRDNMQVDGLTTNQVKSHLQKYRRNYRRITGPAECRINLILTEDGKNVLP